MNLRNSNENNINFYSLLYIEENKSIAVNIKVKSFDEQLSIYIQNALTLSNSLEKLGHTFTLLTNDANRIKKLEFEINHKNLLKVEEITFKTIVPRGIRFYSAHFKIDAYRYLSLLEENQYSILCDLDMIANRNIPKCFINIIINQIPAYYDISDQVIPAYTHKVILSDMQLINDKVNEGRWCGGEFIAGTAKFFKMLINEVDNIFDRYIKHIDCLHHVGDEMLTSVALEIIRQKGVYTSEVGSLGVVGRYWNTQTLHPSKSFNYYKNVFLLHLPSDKKFLADLAKREISTGGEFIKIYLSHINSWTSKTKKSVKWISRLLKS